MHISSGRRSLYGWVFTAPRLPFSELDLACFDVTSTVPPESMKLGNFSFGTLALRRVVRQCCFGTRARLSNVKADFWPPRSVLGKQRASYAWGERLLMTGQYGHRSPNVVAARP